MIRLREVFCVHRTAEGDAVALQGATLDVARGELLCVLGPSGAGKSTLLRVVGGLQSPSAGELEVLGTDLRHASERERRRFRHDNVGFLGQAADLALAPDLGIGKAIAMPLALRGIPAAQRRQRVGDLLDAAGLADRGGALPHELSGGERQRAALCVALAHEPPLLLADEPTGELDEANAARIRGLISELVRAGGATAVIVSHDAATADIADRVARMRDGHIVTDDGDSLVVTRGGWVRLPSALLTAARIRERARVQPTGGGLLLSAVTTARDDPAPPRNNGHGAASWPPVAVDLDGVSRGYPSRGHVIAKLTLNIRPGRLTVVKGRSGAGKTTLLRLIAGLDRPEQGELWVDRVPLSTRDAEQLAALRRERIGYLPQEPTPIDFLSALENVVLSLRLRGWVQDEARERATVALARVGLAGRSRQRVGRLSVGESARVGLARALAGARGLLLVDEPTSKLDQEGAGAVAQLLAEAASSYRQTVICATHDEQLIARADEVLAL